MTVVSDPNNPDWTPTEGWEYILHFDSEDDLQYISRNPSEINPNKGRCSAFEISDSWLRPRRVYTGYCGYPYNDECSAWMYVSAVYAAMHFKLVGGITGYWSGGVWWEIGRSILSRMLSYENFYRETGYHRYKIEIAGQTIYDMNEGVIYFSGPDRKIKLFDKDGNLVLEKSIDINLGKSVDIKSADLLFAARAKFVSTVGGAGSTWMEVDWIAWRESPPRPPSGLDFAMSTKVTIRREGEENDIVNIKYSTPLINWIPKDPRIKEAEVWIEIGGIQKSDKKIITGGSKKIPLEVYTDVIELDSSAIIVNTTISGSGTTSSFNVSASKAYLVITKSAVKHYVNVTDASGNKFFDDIPVNEDIDNDGCYESAFVLLPQSDGTICVYVEAFDGTSGIDVYVIEIPTEHVIDAEIIVKEKVG